MSYARWGEDGSHVYVFGASASKDDADDYLVCMDCTLQPDEDSFSCKSELQMLAHLLLHRERGHIVPERAFERLREEIGET